MSKSNSSKPIAPVLGILVIIAGILGLGGGGGTGLSLSQGTGSSSQETQVQKEAPAQTEAAPVEESAETKEIPAETEAAVEVEPEEEISPITIRVHGTTVEISGTNTPEDVPAVEDLSEWAPLKGSSVILIDDYADSTVYADVKRELEEAGAELYTEDVE